MTEINGTNPQSIQLRRGDTLVVNAYGLGDLSTADDVWFTVKRRAADADTVAVLQVSLTAGLLYIAGAVAATPLNGKLVLVGGGTTGNLKVTVAAVEMAKLAVVGVHDWDIQTLTGTVVGTVVSGQAIVVGDATRSIV